MYRPSRFGFGRIVDDRDDDVAHHLRQTPGGSCPAPRPRAPRTSPAKPRSHLPFCLAGRVSKKRMNSLNWLKTVLQSRVSRVVAGARRGRGAAPGSAFSSAAPYRAQVGPVETGMSLRPVAGRARPSWTPARSARSRSHPRRPAQTPHHPGEHRPGTRQGDPGGPAAGRPAAGAHRAATCSDGVRLLLIRSLLCAGAGALIASLMVFRRPRVALLGLLAASVALAGTGAFAALTFRPGSLVEPRYSGLIAAAPSLVGSAESIVTKFESYRSQLTKLVDNVSKLYDTVSTLPVYDADPRSDPGPARLRHPPQPDRLERHPLAQRPVQGRHDHRHRRHHRPRHQAREQVRRRDRHPRRPVRLRPRQPRLR